MKLLARVGAILAGLAAIVALAWMFRFDLIILLARVQQPNPGPYQVVTWARGPLSPPAPASERPPNIVFILVDDLGFNDITLSGGGVAGGAVPTPHIDSIARNGVTFANGYAGNATCAPSRAAIMTGRYATRFGFEFTPTPVAFSRVVGSSQPPGTLHAPNFAGDRVKDTPPLEQEAVPASEITIAEMLRERGYHTVHLGKWHLGGAPGTRPEQQGFNESLGFISGASMFLPADDPNVVNARQDFDPIDRFLWGALTYGVRYNGGEPFKPNAYMTDYLTDRAVEVIGANRNRPFFLYLAYNAPHTPLQATKADYEALSQIEDHRLRVYAAMIRNLDRNVGRVLAALKAQGLDENTLVIFTSDNGGAHYIGLPEINQPYRGWKATFFEGGVHVPFFMRWPAKLPSGARYESPVGHVDIFATAAGAGGATTPTDRKMDGVDLLPFVTGKAAGDPHASLYWRSGGYRTVLADGWKLQVLNTPKKTWLFDLRSDPTEKRNVADKHPDKVRELSAVLAAQDAEMAPSIWPSLLQGVVAVDHPLGVPDKPDDEFIRWDN